MGYYSEMPSCNLHWRRTKGILRKHCRTSGIPAHFEQDHIQSQLPVNSRRTGGKPDTADRSRVGRLTQSNRHNPRIPISALNLIKNRQSGKIPCLRQPAVTLLVFFSGATWTGFIASNLSFISDVGCGGGLAASRMTRQWLR